MPTKSGITCSGMLTSGAHSGGRIEGTDAPRRMTTEGHGMQISSWPSPNAQDAARGEATGDRPARWPSSSYTSVGLLALPGWQVLVWSPVTGGQSRRWAWLWWQLREQLSALFSLEAE